MGHRVGALLRISYDKQGLRLGVDRQRDICDKLANSRGWEVVDYYDDNNLSAYRRGVVRKEFERLVVDLREGRIDGIVAYDLDRCWRQPKDLERIIDIYDSRSGLVVGTAQGDVDLSSGDGRTMARVLVAFANKSSMDLSRRQTSRVEQRITKFGKPQSGMRCYGYELGGMVIREDEARVWNEMADRSIVGHSDTDIAKWCRANGYLTAYGKPMHHRTVKSYLTNERYAGILKYNGVKYEGTYPAICDREKWERLQLARNARKGTSVRPVSYPLTTLLFCGNCGAPMHGSLKTDARDSRSRRTYRCHKDPYSDEQHCMSIQINADALEHYTRELIFYKLDTPELGKLLRQDNADDVRLGQLLNKRTATQQRLHEILDSFMDTRLSVPELTRIKAKAKDDLDTVQKEIDSLSRSRTASGLIPVDKTLRETWEANKASISWQRNFYSLVLVKAIIHPGQGAKPFYVVDGKRMRFNPDRVEYHWRG